MRAVRMCLSSGTEWRMISWNNFSPSSILLFHSESSSGRLGVHQNSPRSAKHEAMNRFPCSSA